jgi:hypothetical protein
MELEPAGFLLRKSDWSLWRTPQHLLKRWKPNSSNWSVALRRKLHSNEKMSQRRQQFGRLRQSSEWSELRDLIDEFKDIT